MQIEFPLRLDALMALNAPLLQHPRRRNSVIGTRRSGTGHDARKSDGHDHGDHGE